MERQGARSKLATNSVVDHAEGGAVASTSSSGKMVFSDINQMIYDKEKELKEFQEMKCSNLERLVIERDILLIESNKRFEQMKKDFKYNLTLLEVRDKEIERLGRLLEEKGALLLANELDRKVLYDKIVVLESKEDQLSEKYDREKGHYRRVLEEMKEAIEGMKWAALEDGRAKAREIEALKADLVRVMSSRDESLDSQRKDLTQTFEQLLSQREHSCADRERELVGQIAAFASKHEQLQKEVGQLKSDVLESSRQKEGLVGELTRKEEMYRQLQWRAEDERSARQETEDALRREVQQLSIDFSLAKEQLQSDSNDYSRRLEAATNDAARERGFRLAADARHESSKQQLSADLHRLATELAGIKAREAAFEGGLGEMRLERDASEARAAALREEVEALAAVRRSLEREMASAKAAKEGLAEQLAQERASIGALRECADQLKEELRHAAKSSDEYATRQNREERMIMEVKYDAEKAINRLENSCRLLESERDCFAAEARAAAALLEEERGEAAAVALRLRLSEGQLATLQQQLSQLMAQASEQRVAGSPAANAGRQRGVTGLSSPVFSEDFGPASLPASPSAALSPRHRYGRGEQSPADNTMTSSAYSDGTNADSLAAENERLRAVIRDMRQHMDDLQEQHVAAAGDAVLAEKDAKIAALGGRLQEMAAEVQRLRSERRRLMDVGNELRAAVRLGDGAAAVGSYSHGRAAAVAWTDSSYNPADRYALQVVQAAQVGRADALPQPISEPYLKAAQPPQPPLAAAPSSSQGVIREEGRAARSAPAAESSSAASAPSSVAAGVSAVGGARGSAAAAKLHRRDKILLADSLRRRSYGLAGTAAIK